MRMPILTAAILVGVVGCDSLFGPDAGIEPIDELPRELSAIETDLIQRGNSFAFDLFRMVAEAEGDANVFISPLSASIALGMTLNGAAGETFDSMSATLGFDGLELTEINAGYRDLIDLLLDLDPSLEIGIANSVWTREGMEFERPFLTTVGDAFDAHVEALDFDDPAAVTTINEWVERHTNGRIDEVIESIDVAHVMFLINALYFDAEWVHQFDPDDTHDASFERPDGSAVTVKMMKRQGPMRTGRGDGFTALDLRYGGGAYSMTVLLPDHNVELDALVQALTKDTWSDAIDAVTERVNGIVEMPRFRLEYDVRLNEPLHALGMGIAFDDLRADFTRVYPPGDVFIAYVDQSTFVEADEAGTEAAAATTVTMGERSGPPSIRVDRPFVFAIRERFSGTILFIGQVVDPTAG